MDIQIKYCLIKGCKEPLRNFNLKSQRNIYSTKNMNYLLDEAKVFKTLDNNKIPVLPNKKQIISKLLLIPSFDSIRDKPSKAKFFNLDKKNFYLRNEHSKESLPFENMEPRKLTKEFPTRNVIRMKKIAKKNFEIDLLRSFSPEIKEKKPYTVSPLNRARIQSNLKISNKNMHTNICFFDHTVPDSIIIKSKSPDMS